MTNQRLLLIRNDDLDWAVLVQELLRHPELPVIGEATDLATARNLATEQHPTIIAASAQLGDTLILPHLADLWCNCCPSSKIIIFANEWDAAYLPYLADSGIVSYLRWGDLTHELLSHCLLAVANGPIGLGSLVVTNDVLAATKGILGLPATVPGFTLREREVLALLAQDLTREEIAASLGVSLSTVKRIVAELHSKLGASSDFMLCLNAMRRGLVQ